MSAHENLSSFLARNSFASINSKMTLLINMKEIFLANMLMRKKHQVKLKQTWIAVTRVKVLNNPSQRDFNEDRYSFSD